MLTAPLVGLRNVVPVSALVDRPTVMAEFCLDSAIFPALGRSCARPQARRRGLTGGRMAELLMNSAIHQRGSSVRITAVTSRYPISTSHRGPSNYLPQS